MDKLKESESISGSGAVLARDRVEALGSQTNRKTIKGKADEEMVTIGIRAKPTAVTFVVVDGDEIRNIEDIEIPRAFDTPDALKYVRNNLLDILREYRVEVAGVRVTEPNAHSLNIARIQLEGVIQEAFASSSLRGYYVGQIASISARIGVDRADFKKMVDGENKLKIDLWADLSKDAREALLCALGAKNVLA